MRKRLIWLIAILFSSSLCLAQKVTIRGKSMPVADVFTEITKQTNVVVICNGGMLKQAPAVDLNLRNAGIATVMHACLDGLNLDYKIHSDKNTIVVFSRNPDLSLFLPIRGYVRSGKGELLCGATISMEGGSSFPAGADGRFKIPAHSHTMTVRVSYHDHVSSTVLLDNRILNVIELQPFPGLLDAVIVEAYGNTTKRLAAGSITQVDSSAIALQGTGNPLGALEGQVPGMVAQRYNGVPGSAYQLLIRGRHSIAQGTNPLIVVDGLPIADDAGYLGTIGEESAQGPMGASVLNGIPASAIASIQVLQDAAATAIYGSRGANGVLLVTLRPGVAGKVQWGVDVSTGWEGTVKTSPLLNTSQYLALREEAVRNDGLQPGPGNIPELNWDTTRYTNFQRAVIGHTGVLQQCQVNLTGGDSHTTFLLSGSYYGETAVFPGASNDNRMSIYGRLHHQFGDHRVTLDLSVLYSWEHNLLPGQDLSYTMYLAPDAPPFRNAMGQLQWSSDGVSFLNIPALGYNTYKGSVNHQYDHLMVGWKLWRGLELNSSVGYYSLAANEYSQLLIAGQDPAIDPTGQTTGNNNAQHGELIEETAAYTRGDGKGQLRVLAGVTWQEQVTDSIAQQASGYTSDLLLETGSGNPMIISSTNRMIYRYEALFGRLNYQYLGRYILEVTGRRDGSSRFGPGHQFGNFWAVSGAWIFRKEHWLSGQQWLSFGKLRGSIGTTGNDQIGSNSPTQFYTTENTSRGYQNLQGVIPNSYSDNHLQYEVNYNSEVALDLGFLQDKLLFSLAGYQDWTTNQLVSHSLPSQSGLPAVFSNVPASVVNEGLEMTLQAALTHGRVQWTAAATLTMPANRLRRFPDLAHSGYAQTLVIGKSLTVLKAYHFEGVDPGSGLYTFKGINRNGGVLNAQDLVTGGNWDPHYYGGLAQHLRYRQFELDVFIEYRLQSGSNPYVTLYRASPPGLQDNSMVGNGPVQWLRRWQRSGDHAPIEKLTASDTSVAYARMLDYIASDANSIPAGYIRLKSCQLAYCLSGRWLQRWSITACRLYIDGQDLLTITHYPITDPTTQDPTILPPMRSVRAGIKLNL